MHLIDISRPELAFELVKALPPEAAHKVAGIMDAEPRVDAVQVVRCKDCKHCKRTPDMLICRVNALSSRPVSEEFFCGFGEEVKNV